MLAAGARRLVLDPIESRIKTIIAPEQLAAGSDKSRGAKYIEPLSLLSVCTKFRLDLIGLSACQHRAGILFKLGQNFGDSVSSTLRPSPNSTR